MKRIFVFLMCFLSLSVSAKTFKTPDLSLKLDYEEVDFVDVKLGSLAPMILTFQVGDEESSLPIHFKSMPESMLHYAAQAVDVSEAEIVFESYNGIEGLYVTADIEGQYFHQYFVEVKESGRVYCFEFQEDTLLELKNIEALGMFDSLRRSLQFNSEE